MKFGDRLKAKRNKLNITSQNLADLCGISRSYITLIENNKRLPGKSVIPKLAKALDLEVTVIINWYLETVRESLSK